MHQSENFATYHDLNHTPPYDRAATQNVIAMLRGNLPYKRQLRHTALGMRGDLIGIARGVGAGMVQDEHVRAEDSHKIDWLQVLDYIMGLDNQNGDW